MVDKAEFPGAGTACSACPAGNTDGDEAVWALIAACGVLK